MAANPFRTSPAGGASAPLSSGSSSGDTKLPPLSGATKKVRKSPRRRAHGGVRPKPNVVPESGVEDDPHSNSSPVTATKHWTPTYTGPGDSAARRAHGGATGTVKGHLPESPGQGGSNNTNNTPRSGTSHVSSSGAPASTSQRGQSPSPALVAHANAFGSLTSFGGSVGGNNTSTSGGGGGIPAWRVSNAGPAGLSDEDTSRCFSVMSADPGSVTDTPSGLQPTRGGYGALGDAMHTAPMRRASGSSMAMGSHREGGDGDDAGGSLPDLLPDTDADADYNTLLPGLMGSPDPLNRTASPVPYVSKRVLPEWRDEDFQPKSPCPAEAGRPSPKRAQIVAPSDEGTKSPSVTGGIPVHVPPRRVAFAP